MSLVFSVAFHVSVFAMAAHWLGERGGSENGDTDVMGGPETEVPAMTVKVATKASHASAPAASTPGVLSPRRPVLVARTELADLALPPPSRMADLPAATPSFEPSLDLASITPAAASGLAATSAKQASASTARKRSVGRGGAGEGRGSGSGIGNGGATAPRPLATRVPAYPWSARKSGAEGVVLVRVMVSEAGRVEASSVYRSSGHEDLDAAAVACVAKWSFSPGQSGGRPVAAAAVVRVAFRLES